MPELPEIEAYRRALANRIVGEEVTGIRIRSFSLLKTVEPQPAAAIGRRVTDVGRLGKRLVVGLDNQISLVIHLMVAGRLKWSDEGSTKIPAKYGLAAFDFSSGSLLLTEAGTKRRASLHIVEGADALAELDPGGIEVSEATRDDVEARLKAERHTLKRSLTDPRFFSGIGGALADEILHRAKISPLAMSTSLDGPEIAALHRAMQEATAELLKIRLDDAGEDFPKKVTAFHPQMAVHGKYGEPCPVCGSPVQRIVYRSRETNYCATCQTGGRILADRSLSRLLKEDYPRHIDDAEFG